ncbi:beta-glucosidase family protein [Demequina gelatinilytica]|uniref:beta-glucosidase family protein n=1 Tax=Demequina gelatinilytica TaxID=1638980 RepID=UPI000AE39A04|nr:glycoside hydrolase family 3 C-terminal domain-containing protein [Demequina gelatinilytica]
MTLPSLDAREAHATLEGCRVLARALPLERKVLLLTGATMWRLHALPELGLRGVAFSDGPVGVRGLGDVDGATSILFPTPSAIAATWDVALAFEVGRAFAREARDHGVDVVLAPQVNIQRTPVGGRHFECFSEDPWLTSAIGTTVVRGIQDQGVAACMKHYVANDSETERTSYVSRLGMQALREVYLAPFEDAVEAGVWSVMAAYNGADDGVESAPMTAHRHLLVDVLKDELGFDGVVVSDWEATGEGEPAANGGLDLVMPGPAGPWGERLLAAVHAGRVSEREIDDKVARVLLLAGRVGALGEGPAPVTHAADLRALVRRAAASSMVVLRRGDDAPWDRPAPATIALIGPNALRPHVLGGGSSTVHPAHVVTPAEGLAARWPDASIVLARGGDPRAFAPRLQVGRVGVRHRDDAGRVLGVQEVVGWDGWLRDVPAEATEVELTVAVRLTEPGTHRLSVGTVGAHRIMIDGVEASASDASVGVDCVLDSSVNNPAGAEVEVHVAEPRDVDIVAMLQVIDAGGYGRFVRGELRHALPGPSADEEIDAAVAAARAAQLAVVIVGTNEESESEGWDRTTLALPGRQDELVERVLDVAPDAVILVNAGAPVLLPWLERARTVLWAWFPGQEAGHAIADVLAGEVEPGGRLPWTLPAREADVPVPHAIPDAGIVRYDEGVHVGYRGWERSAAEPAAPFGHGLGWSSWRYDVVGVPRLTGSGDLEIDVDVTNVGTRGSREVVQVYVEAQEGAHERPVRWLGGFVAVHARPGETVRARVTVARRRLEVWDTETAAWVLPAGEYRLRAGRSVRDLRLDTAVRLEAPESRRRDDEDAAARIVRD